MCGSCLLLGLRFPHWRYTEDEVACPEWRETLVRASLLLSCVKGFRPFRGQKREARNSQDARSYADDTGRIVLGIMCLGPKPPTLSWLFTVHYRSTPCMLLAPITSCSYFWETGSTLAHFTDEGTSKWPAGQGYTIWLKKKKWSWGNWDGGGIQSMQGNFLAQYFESRFPLTHARFHFYQNSPQATWRRNRNASQPSLGSFPWRGHT